MFVANVKAKYPYMTNSDIESIVDKAKMFYYAIKFPCEPTASEVTRPISNFVSQQWVLSACDEIIERLGFNTAIGYRENGVSWTFDGAYLSERLVSLIKPVIGVI